ncbi:MAG: MauE/DoxX family redox-associated membrane protein [Spirochaetota bacterium]
MKITDLATNRFLALTCRILIGTLFIYASVDKILHPVSFAHTFANYAIMPDAFTPLVAIFVPWFELIAGTMFIIGFRTRSTAIALILLLSAFLVGITVNLVRGADMDCGCFEFFGIPERLSISTFLRDVLFIALTLPPFFAPRQAFAIDSRIEKGKQQ